MWPDGAVGDAPVGARRAAGAPRPPPAPPRRHCRGGHLHALRRRAPRRVPRHGRREDAAAVWRAGGGGPGICGRVEPACCHGGARSRHWREREKTEKKITHLPFDRRFLVSSNCDGASDGKKQQQLGEERTEQGRNDWCFL